MNMQQVYLWLSLHTAPLFSANQKTGLPPRAFGPRHGIVVTRISLYRSGEGKSRGAAPGGEPEPG